MEAGHGFSVVDWAIILAYMAGMLVIGAVVSRRQNGTEEFFLGGRTMPAWAVSLSVIASSLSAATFIGVPQMSFSGDLRYLSTYIGACLGGFVVAVFFVPPLYRAGTITIYGYLERRYGVAAKIAASALFLFGRLLASGARLFMAGIGFALMWYGGTTPGELVPVIIVLGVVGTFYTVCGGIRAVIWTDTVQITVTVIAATAAVFFLLRSIPLPVPDIVAALRTAEGGDKLLLVDTSLKLSAPYTIWAGVFAMTVVTVSTHGVDHDMLQRVMAARSPLRGGMALAGSMLLTVPVVALFLGIGLLLHIYYARPDLMGAAAPADALTDTKNVFPQYVLWHMPSGLRGLTMAGLFASAMSTFDSAINAMASCLVADIYLPWRAWRLRRDGRAETPGATHVAASRAAVALMGAGLTVFAVLAVHMQHSGNTRLIDFALGVMAFALAPLLGVFCAALFTRRGNGASMLLSTAAGVAMVLLLQPWMFPAARWEWSVGWPWHWVIVSPVCFLICIAGKPAPARGAEGPEDAAC